MVETEARNKKRSKMISLQSSDQHHARFHFVYLQDVLRRRRSFWCWNLAMESWLHHNRIVVNMISRTLAAAAVAETAPQAAATKYQKQQRSPDTKENADNLPAKVSTLVNQMHPDSNVTGTLIE